MPSARGTVSGDDDMTEYERLKWEHVARNQEKMDSLCLRKLSAECQRPQANKRKKGQYKYFWAAWSFFT